MVSVHVGVDVGHAVSEGGEGGDDWGWLVTVFTLKKQRQRC